MKITIEQFGRPPLAFHLAVVEVEGKRYKYAFEAKGFGFITEQEYIEQVKYDWENESSFEIETSKAFQRID